MQKIKGILFLLIGIALCILGIAFYFTIGWFSVPLSFGLGIISIITGIVMMIRKSRK